MESESYSVMCDRERQRQCDKHSETNMNEIGCDCCDGAGVRQKAEIHCESLLSRVTRLLIAQDIHLAIRSYPRTALSIYPERSLLHYSIFHLSSAVEYGL
jgi:hypothetical protein